MINYQRIIIIVVSFFLAFCTGRQILRNLWRLYKTPLERMVATKDARWHITTADVDFKYISFEKENIGFIDSIPFQWENKLFSKELKISGLSGKYKDLNGFHRIKFSNNRKHLCLTNSKHRLAGKLSSNRIIGFICKLEHANWEVNQKIPWF